MLLLILALLQDPSLDDLLKRLNDEAIAEREKAATRIVAMGEPALARLRKALASSSGEEKARIETCIAGIERDRRRRAFPGGVAVKGLSGALSANKVIYQGDEAITLTLEIMNTSDAPSGLVPPESLDENTPTGGGSTTSSHGVIDVKLLYGPVAKSNGREIGCGVGPQGQTKTLQSGESVTGSSSFNDRSGYTLAPGLYQATATYYASTKRLVEGAAADIVSKPIVFWVGPFDGLFRTLVADLDSDDLEIRAVAEARLFELRTVVRDWMKGAMEKAGTEAKLRLAALSERMERRSRLETLKGGMATAGLQAFLSTSKAKVKTGDTIELDLEVANVTDSTTDFITIEYLEWKLPEYSSKLTAAAAAVQITRLSGTGSDKHTFASAGTMEPPPRKTTRLKPDETWTKSLKVATAGTRPLGAGEYEIRIVYYASSRKLVGDAPKDLESNTVRVVIED